MSGLGVHSQTGRLRRVITCAPGLAHERLTPANCDALLFDDVFWVAQARNDRRDFCDKMTDRGVEVLRVHDLLSGVLEQGAARRWILDRRVDANAVGVGMLDEMLGWLEELPPQELARFLIGGIAVHDLPFAAQGMTASVLGPESFLLPPLPNMLFTRDTSAWVYGGVLLNPMHWRARRAETLLMDAIYRFYPLFGTKARVWWGGAALDIRAEKKDFFAVVAEALGVKRLHIVPTGGDSYEQARGAVGRRQQRRRGRAGRRHGLRPQHLHQHAAAQGGDRGPHPARIGAGAGQGRRPLHDLPDPPGSA